MKTTTIKELKQKAEKVKRKELKFISKIHSFRCNKIASMFFEGNYRVKPPIQSLFRFAMTKREDWEIREFLSCTETHFEYNY